MVPRSLHSVPQKTRHSGRDDKTGRKTQDPGKKSNLGHPQTNYLEAESALGGGGSSSSEARVAESSGMGRFSRVSVDGASSRASSVAGEMPSSVPRASRARASNSLRLGSSSRSLRPKRIRNSLEDL